MAIDDAQRQVSMTINSSCPLSIPLETFEALKNYVMNHRDPGGFLTAVLSNDLMGAMLRGSPESLSALPIITGYIYNACPGSCWGSLDAVRSWVRVPNKKNRALHLVVPGLGD